MKKEIVEKFKSLINDTEKELNILEKANKYVVIYQNKNNDTIYSLTSIDMNMISEVHNIIPYPSPNYILTMDKEKAITYSKHHLCIKNGFGIIFDVKVISYIDYIKLYLKEIKTSYQTIINI